MGASADRRRRWRARGDRDQTWSKAGMVNTTVVILAAGMGTRMRSRHAKVLHRAAGLPLIHHVVRSALAITTPERVIVVTGHQAEEVEQSLAGMGIGFV